MLNVCWLACSPARKEQMIQASTCVNNVSVHKPLLVKRNGFLFRASDGSSPQRSEYKDICLQIPACINNGAAAISAWLQIFRFKCSLCHVSSFGLCCNLKRVK